MIIIIEHYTKGKPEVCYGKYQTAIWNSLKGVEHSSCQMLNYKSLTEYGPGITNIYIIIFDAEETSGKN